MTEKRVLCFGDSNTWGFDPATGQRYPKEVRWVGRLSGLLGADFDVISEGLNGRCATGPDPVMRLNSAYDDLEVALRTHMPIEHVVMMLGTNDFKRRFALSERDIITGLGHLVDLILKSDELVGRGANRLILVAPLAINLDGALDPAQAEHRALDFKDAVDVSKRLPAQIKHLAQERGCTFVDPNETLKSSELDAIHWDAETHADFAEMLAQRLVP
ncbi:MAG: GDSL-type esterase/lipase family protein [Pseudomonadota bacterium]|nr:GDSL-type esterase/lipase family protein [Pseudomonadota bacterium]